MVYEEEKRQWQPREMAMASEFIAKTWPRAKHITRARLGVPHPELVFKDVTEEELRLLRVYSRWADALVLLPNRIILIECKIRPKLGPTEALDLYARLFKQDTAYRQYWRMPLEKWFVYAIQDPVLNELAEEKGIRCVQYEPDWLPAYKKILQQRETRAPLTRQGE